MNKVEKIKAYLERRIAEICDASQGYILDKQMKTEYLLLYELLSFIDSLSDTEKDFGIKESVIPFGASDSELMEATYFIPQGYHAVIDGNKVIIKKGEDHVSNDFDSFAKEYSFNIPSDIYNLLPKEKQSSWIIEIENAVKAGAQWQKQQDQLTIELAEDHAMLAGMEKMKQEMMKNVVLETKVMKDNDGDGIDTPYEEWLTLEDTEIPFIPDNIGLKDGDKVKVIIIKQ